MSLFQNSKKIVYLVDDDQDDRVLFLDAIENLNLSVEVEELADGQELLDILQKSPKKLPEIIFLDINMPRKSGFDCLLEIKNGNCNILKKIKIIMLSTSSNHFNIDKAFELGADYYAVKPNTFDGLKKLVKEVFETDWDQHHVDSRKILAN